MKRQPRLTRERAASLLSYDSITGRIFSSVQRGRLRVGEEVGTVSAKGYRNIVIDREQHLAHRLAWLLHFGTWPRFEIDHIDGDPGNNAIANLRDVSRSVNHQNRKRARKGSKSGVLGVRFDRRSGRPISEIKVGDRYVYLGSFDTIDQARAAYVEAKRKHHEGCTL